MEGADCLSDDDSAVKKVVERLVNKESIEAVDLKKLKNLCKRSDSNVEYAYKHLMSQLEKNHCVVRLNCVLAVDQLFHRSHKFRLLVLEDFNQFTDLAMGCSPGKPLPAPASFHRNIRSESIKCIKQWNVKFGDAYVKLRLAYNYLDGNIVDFQDLCLTNDEERIRKNARLEKQTRIWSERVKKVRDEFEEYEVELDSWFTRVDNLVALLGSAPVASHVSNLTEELAGCVAVFKRRFLPKSKDWCVTLTKAGQSSDQDLLRKAVEVKAKLCEYFEKIEQFDSGPNLVNSTDTIQDGEAKTVTKQKSVDPTTWDATLLRVTGASIKLNTSLEDKPSYCENASLPSSSSGAVPLVRLEDITEPDRMVVDPDRSRFWVSDHREGAVIPVGRSQRVTALPGNSEPVVWSCRAPLPSGSLCPRRDRVRCPLHGPVVARDRDGRPVGAEVGEPRPPPASLPAAPATKKTRKLRGADKWDESSRSRIEKKIFNRSSASRVARDLKKYDKIRTSNKFTDQFNY